MKRIITEKTNQKVRKQLTSPRAAAAAGILFSLLMFIVMIMVHGFIELDPENIIEEWTENWSGTASQIITLISFAGIAFLWFTGVIRDRLGDQEDQFFATIFLSSGIILVLLFFFWGAILGAILRTEALLALPIASHLYIFAFTPMNQIFDNYALRVASIYMISICTLWTKTGVMPRWLTALTYILAFGFLFTVNIFREARFIFPSWVLVVSLYILYLNYLNKHQLTDSNGSQN